MTNKKLNVPELRFPGFEGEWKKKLLDEIANVQMGQSPNSQNYTDDFEEMVLVQGNADLKNGKVSPRIFTKEITKIAKRNDILLSVRAPVGEIGITQMPVCIGRGVCSITSNLFTYYFLDYFNNGNKWKKFSQGSTFEAISGNEVRNLIIFSPSEKEQQKIGDFFSKLDRQIDLEEQKLEKLEQQKKGYMQKIFSQQLRFKDENGNNYPDWEIRDFMDNINKVIDFRGKTPKKIGLEWSKSGYLALSALNVKNGYIDYSVDANFGDEKLYKKWMGENELKKGQVLFTTEAPMGNVAQVPDNKGYILSQRTIAFNVHQDKITENFLVFLLRSSNIIKRLMTLASGATAKGVSQKSLKKLVINVPSSLEEQGEISGFLKSIDIRKTKQKSKIIELKLRKQAFLQKMFI